MKAENRKEGAGERLLGRDADGKRLNSGLRDEESLAWMEIWKIEENILSCHKSLIWS